MGQIQLACGHVAVAGFEHSGCGRLVVSEAVPVFLRCCYSVQVPFQGFRFELKTGGLPSCEVPQVP